MNTTDIGPRLRSESVLLGINYVLLSGTFALNFLGHPILKFWLLGYVAFAAITALSCDFRTSAHVLLGLSFVEGQARVLWNYHPAFRLAFDLVVALALLRTVVARREGKLRGLLPGGMAVFAVLHFAWYVVEIFNPANVGFLAPIAATKIYIFPLLVFLMFRANSRGFDGAWVEGLATTAVMLSVAEGALALYQMRTGEALLLGISPHYSAAMKTDVFVGKDFRPFGTTFLPGVVSVYLFLTAGFLMLRRRFTTWQVILRVVVVGFVAITMLGSQVRSAMVKYSLVLVASLIAVWTTSPVPLSRKLAGAGAFVAALAIAGILALPYLANSPLAGIEAGLRRWQDIQSVQDFQSKRVTPSLALKVVAERLLSFPIGIGPGLTGAASSVSRDVMDRDPIYDREVFWGYDNLFLSLVIEFGVGAIFYVGLVLSAFVSTARAAWRARLRGDAFAARVGGVALAQMGAILLGNWGAIGLPYNPESYFYWFWAALALNLAERPAEEAA